MIRPTLRAASERQIDRCTIYPRPKDRILAPDRLLQLGPPKKARVGEMDVGYKEFGSGHPLLLLTGLSAIMDMWDGKLVKKLAERHRIVMFDYMGMGHTTYSKGKFSLERTADETAAFMDAIGIPHAHILGWSMGADICMALALQHPGKVDKLVLYAGDCGKKGKLPSAGVIINGVITSLFRNIEQYKKLAVRILFPEDWRKEHENLEVFLASLTENPLFKVRCGYLMASLAWDVYDKLPDIKQPTLLVTGDRDIVVPPVNSEIIAELIPNSRLAVIKGGGHGLMYQYPEIFAKAVIEFLSSTQP